jgi:hypothetical protein
MLAARDSTVAETTAIVVTHLLLVISIVVVCQTYSLNRVVLAVKFHEDANKLFCDETVADHLSMMSLSVVVPMHQSQVTQVAATYDIIWLPGFPLHLLPDTVGNLMDGEPSKKILALHRTNGAEPE